MFGLHPFTLCKPHVLLRTRSADPAENQRNITTGVSVTTSHTPQKCCNEDFRRKRKALNVTYSFVTHKRCTAQHTVYLTHSPSAAVGSPPEHTAELTPFIITFELESG